MRRIEQKRHPQFSWLKILVCCYPIYIHVYNLLCLIALTEGKPNNLLLATGN
ncbi:hypothetical protein [uncultured Bartonella sp.]|uniref:hypothetical protein n=1 Tax=uncultured Bartonella sp. TaxID=104108 RepID=UPI002622510E|nr:hypothetical protein [uncultured Bartonella sp.]